MMRSLAVKVKINRGEDARRYLSKIGIIREDLLIKREGDYLLIPVKRKIRSFKIIEDEFMEKVKKSGSYLDMIDIPDRFKHLLPRGFDIIGDIALVKIPDDIEKYGEEIGESILEVHRGIKVVFQSKPVRGEYRVRDIKFLAGEDRTLTLHREYGIRLLVDVKEVFFSPRLSGERYRVARMVKEGETILDMFAGVGSFSIVIAKLSKPNIIYAIDKNPRAVELAKENIKMNKILDKVEMIQGDARDVTDRLVRDGKRMDRIIMNLPFSSYKFFDVALSASSNDAVIHYYDILKEKDIESRVDLLRSISEDLDRSIEIKKIKKIKTYAPREFYTGFDIVVK